MAVMFEKFTVVLDVIVLMLSLMTLAVTSSSYYGQYICKPGRDVAVQLFEWKWTDVQKECTWLAEHNFCAVQVSPPNEHRVVTNPPYPWYQRYQPVSYKMTSRSGTEEQFREMLTACNNLGVYVYVDAVLNHMTGGGGNEIGSNGSYFNGDAQSYPAVPFVNGDFHDQTDCSTSDLNIAASSYTNDAWQVRNCRLVALRDLRGNLPNVQAVQSNYLSKLVNWGVAGFRIDAAKHMWPAHIYAILNQVNNLNTTWFPPNSRPYVYQEVIDFGGEAVNYHDYTYIGRVLEFRHGRNLGDVLRKNLSPFGSQQQLKYLRNFGESWNELNALDAVVFIDNHDNQRHPQGRILTFFESNLYKIANAFQLAWQYGHVRIMSSYYWPRQLNANGDDTNSDIGPPSNSSGHTRNVVCFDGNWVCEHRWRQIFNMVKFHNAALGQPVVNWWDNGQNAIAFGRGNRAFIVINNENFPISQYFQTGLPAGNYCDVISCDNNRPPCGNAGGNCRPVITVDSNGYANIYVSNGEDPMIAMYQ